MRWIAFCLILIPAALRADEPALVIRNATVETLATAGRVERATVVVRDGKIAAIGKDIAAPDDATVIDAAGGTLMPGVIDPYFEVSVAAASVEAPGRTVVGRPGGRGNFGGGFGMRPTGAFTRLADNFYPHDPGFKPLPRVGLTRLNLVTTGGGQSAVVRVTPHDAERMLASADGLAFATVTNSTDSLDQIRNRLESAGRATSGGANLWNDVVDGKTPFVVQAQNPAAVLHLLKATESYKNLRLVLFLAGDAIAETAAQLKERRIRVILRPGLELMPNTRDRFSPARLLHESGVDFAFSLSARPPAVAAGGRFGAAPPTPDDVAEGTATLTIDQDAPLFPVAILVKCGLPRQQALEALTKRPAILMGIDKTHGTIETGKAADLLLFTGDPLDPGARLRNTIVDGRIVHAN